MSKFKGTKSTWRIGRPGTVVSDNKQSITIVGGVGKEAIKYYGGNLICESVSEANALLISKAPELLEMLEKVINNSDVPNKIFDEAKKLIKQSTTL